MMTDRIEADICVIGAGSGGLSIAAGASQMGAKVAIIERGKMGGDCLNYGCVPSKALLAVGHKAHEHRTVGAYGIRHSGTETDFSKVNLHIRNVIDEIGANDSIERFEGLGVRVIKADAEFVSRREVLAGDVAVTAKYFVVATGSSVNIPTIPGLDGIPYLTNETIFQLENIPEHLVVIGGGPMGCELGQAYRRLGAQVTIVERFSILADNDVEGVAAIRLQLRKDDVKLCEGVNVVGVSEALGCINVEIVDRGYETIISCTHLLLATGRHPNLASLNLEAAGIKYSSKGIEIDSRLRTTNKRIFAIGDVIGDYQFTHVANYHAGIVIRNMLFKIPTKFNYKGMPRITYTEPELANVGLTQAQAVEILNTNIRILRWPFSENDRARIDDQFQGFIKVIADRKGRIHGVSIAGSQAGELILPWVLAIENDLKLSSIASVIAPYPTRGEISKRVAGSFYMTSLFGERTKKLVRFLLKF